MKKFFLFLFLCSCASTPFSPPPPPPRLTYEGSFVYIYERDKDDLPGQLAKKLRKGKCETEKIDMYCEPRDWACTEKDLSIVLRNEAAEKGYTYVLIREKTLRIYESIHWLGFFAKCN